MIPIHSSEIPLPQETECIQKLRADYKQQNEDRKQRRGLLRAEIYERASCSDKMKMIIRSWFEKSD
jgi:hypothetical protein